MEINYEAYARLNRILENNGPSEFGRISQILLAFAFVRTGYKVSNMQLSGRPDMVVEKDGKFFNIEAKTSSGSQITLKKEDIESVKKLSGVPIISILTFPDIDSRWLFIDAKKLYPGKIDKSYLVQFSVNFMETDINSIFSIIVKEECADNITGQKLHEKFNRLYVKTIMP
ncbi:MAG: hypothetical protein JRN37_04075 [Nitrososphaerota archaeon]|jgi:Holliday junction resolvase|nr:hypothetical protein [Nitrososphaerota archaeon]